MCTATDIASAVALRALGVVALAAGDPASAAALLLEATASAGGVSADPAVSAGLPPDLIEALGRLGDAARLRACAWQLRIRRPPSPAVRGWASHAAALAAAADGDPQGAIVELETAIRCAEDAGEPFELGRVLVTYGQSQRRLRRKHAARAALTRAGRLFACCGAESWAVRARGELARTGVVRLGTGTLTVTERRVGELAAEGLSNGEIGAALFVSRRTVEVNLARAYGKLGIRNRAQLGTALARGGAPAIDGTSPAEDGGRAVRSALAVLRPGRPPLARLGPIWPAAA